METEVLLADKRGGRSVTRFNGMFSFALYDRVRGVLFCARDRYGEKPFCFIVERFFAFSSEKGAFGVSVDLVGDR